MDFETQISLLTQAPPKISPSKRTYQKYKPRGLFSEFYSIRPHPSTRVGFCLKTDILPPGLAHRPHLSGENGHRKRIFSKTVSRVEIFENADFSFTCGRTKTEVFE